MVRLLLLNVVVVGVHEVDRLSELDVVNKANELVFTVAKCAPKVNHANNRVHALHKVYCYACHHKIAADRFVLLLHFLELLEILRFFLDVVSLL